MHHGLMFSYRKERGHRGTGAHRIASYLRASNWDIEVLDFAIEFTLDELKEFVRSRVNSNTKFFGFSSFINWWPEDTNNFTKWLKETYPNIPTILGGHGCLITPAQNIDYWVDSFGEVAMLELCRHISGNLIFHTGLQFEDYQGRKVIRALHNFPAWNLPTYRNTHEKRDFIESFEMLTIETSRGCKFKCDFCNFPILGVKEDTSRSRDDIKDELYNKAVEIIKTEGKASTSFLQRKLGIGYNRAARIIDQMEEEKIISPANHVGKREIY